MSFRSILGEDGECMPTIGVTAEAVCPFWPVVVVYGGKVALGRLIFDAVGGF